MRRKGIIPNTLPVDVLKIGGDHMAILAECPACHARQARKNKKCIGWLDKKSGLRCTQNLDDAKKAKKSGTI